MDTSIRVNDENKVDYRYFEKTTTTNTTIREQSAMSVSPRIQSLSNDLDQDTLKNLALSGVSIFIQMGAPSSANSLEGKPWMRRKPRQECQSLLPLSQMWGTSHHTTVPKGG